MEREEFRGLVKRLVKEYTSSCLKEVLDCELRRGGTLFKRLKDAILADVLEAVRHEFHKKVDVSYGVSEQRKEGLSDKDYDDITSVHSRAFFETKLSGELSVAKWSRFPLSIAMLSVDRFFHLKNEFGESVSNRVLREVADILKGTVRGRDIVARYEGEEFAVILPRTDEFQAFSFGERVRVLIERHRFSTAGEGIERITVCIGIATYPIGGRYQEELIRSASQALGLAKKGGGNRVCSSR
jgi:diguanylate cyclase (GGDEF)-like protein